MCLRYLLQREHPSVHPPHLPPGKAESLTGDITDAACSIFVTQAIGAPLYYYSKDLFYAWMAMTKQHFGIVITTMTYWWAPVKMRISGDASVRGQLRKTEDGRIECDFPERMVLISNHQVAPPFLALCPRFGH